MGFRRNTYKDKEQAMDITIYNKANGEIIQYKRGPSSLIEYFTDNLPDTQGWVDGRLSALNNYIVDGVVTEKPTLPISINGSIISGVPTGTKFSVVREDNGDSVEDTVDDGIIDLSESSLGDYRVVFQNSFPHKYKSIKLEVI